jgi:hypothetical protein
MAKTTNLPRSDGSTKTDTAAQALAARGPRAVAPAAAPQGRKLAGNVGPGTLYPGAGKLVQRTGTPLRCGTIAGTASDFTEAPNTRDPSRMSTRFVGEAIVVDYAGTVMRAAEWYLPPTATRGLKAQLKHSAGSVMFAFEIWCEPDMEGRPPSPLGYAYVSYDRQPARDNDPLMALAYEAGILERPASALSAPDADPTEEFDPETGEIRPATPASQQAA